MATAHNKPLDDLFGGNSPSVESRASSSPPNINASLELRELGDAVARRTRSLIAPSPILELEADKSKRDVDLSRHDLRMLCLIALDTVIDRMGFGSGATRRDIQIALAPIIYASEPSLPPERERLLLDIILDALLNEKRQRQRFVARYATLEGGAVRWLEFEYALLEERQSASLVRPFNDRQKSIAVQSCLPPGCAHVHATVRRGDRVSPVLCRTRRPHLCR